MLGVLKADDKSIEEIKPMPMGGGAIKQQVFGLPAEFQRTALLVPIEGRAAAAKSISPGVRMSKDATGGAGGGAVGGAGGGTIGSMVDELSEKYGQNPLDFDTADLLENPGKNIHEIMLLGLGAAALYYFARRK